MDISDNLKDLWQLMAEPKNLLVFVLLAVGYICRQVEVIPNRIIPLIVLLAGCIFGPVVVSPIPNGIMYGIALSGLATLIYESVLKHAEDFIVSKLGVKKDDEEKP